jgi:hypothetical protein
MKSIGLILVCFFSSIYAQNSMFIFSNEAPIGASPLPTFVLVDLNTIDSVTFFYATPNSLPSINTVPVSNVTGNSCNSGITIINNGSSSITQFGLCWSVNPNPTVNDSYNILTGSLSNGTVTNIGTLTTSIFGLTANTQYYIRAYALNSVGVSYGQEFVFITLP